MKLSEGVEQAIHCTAFLAGLSQRRRAVGCSTGRTHGVSTSYLLKHLQAQSGAGIVATTPGPKGGYRLAKAQRTSAFSTSSSRLKDRRPRPMRRDPPARTEPSSAALFHQNPCQINAAMLKA